MSLKPLILLSFLAVTFQVQIPCERRVREQIRFLTKVNFREAFEDKDAWTQTYEEINTMCWALINGDLCSTLWKAMNMTLTKVVNIDELARFEKVFPIVNNIMRGGLYTCGLANTSYLTDVKLEIPSGGSSQCEALTKKAYDSTNKLQGFVKSNWRFLKDDAVNTEVVNLFRNNACFEQSTLNSDVVAILQRLYELAGGVDHAILFYVYRHLFVYIVNHAYSGRSAKPEPVNPGRPCFPFFEQMQKKLDAAIAVVEDRNTLGPALISVKDMSDQFSQCMGQQSGIDKDCLNFAKYFPKIVFDALYSVNFASTQESTKQLRRTIKELAKECFWYQNLTSRTKIII
eukprot:TRINITY_DN9572_c0_g1_i2.p1 TRINITY_DN9572_c0_g1~~TRINITY_DN9572_c0_g1_i2.p1  ORF type:complete len:344 (+),score=71.85 TRINITY_DN9572_c0_g1_i2:167-1198(+)